VLEDSAANQRVQPTPVLRAESKSGSAIAESWVREIRCRTGRQVSFIVGRRAHNHTERA